MRNAIGLLLRLYSYFFHLILSLFFVGISSIAISTGEPLQLDMLPWKGATLNQAALGLGILGILCVFLAVTGILRYLFPIWALFVPIMLVRGFFLTPYNFGGAAQFRAAVWLTLGALAAFIGSITVLGARRRNR